MNSIEVGGTGSGDCAFALFRQRNGIGFIGEGCLHFGSALHYYFLSSEDIGTVGSKCHQLISFSGSSINRQFRIKGNGSEVCSTGGSDCSFALFRQRNGIGFLREGCLYFGSRCNCELLCGENIGTVSAKRCQLVPFSRCSYDGQLGTFRNGVKVGSTGSVKRSFAHFRQRNGIRNRIFALICRKLVVYGIILLYNPIFPLGNSYICF